MQPHQQRVVDEKRELDERLNKLVQFMGTEQCGDLPEPERWLLSLQRTSMAAYSTVLGQRLALWDGPKDCPHAAPFRYCDGCKVTPCPIGLGD